jgi:hypothetical protein
MIGHADQRRNARPRLIPSWSAKAGYPRLCGLPQRKTWMAAMTVSGRGHRELGVGCKPKLIDDDPCVAPTVMVGLGPATHVFCPTQTRKTWMAGARPGHDIGIDEALSTSVGTRQPTGKGSIAAIRPSTHSDWRTARDTQAAAPRPVRFSAPKYWRGSSGRRARNPDWQAAPDVLHPSNAQTTAVARCRCAPNGSSPHSGVHRLHLWGRWCRRDYQREGWHPHRSA